MIRVGKGIDCDVMTITEAIAMAKEQHENRIYITTGTYEEKLVLDLANVEIIGEDKDKTIITFNDYAKKKDADGIDYGTFRTATLRIDADNVTLKDLTIINSSGNGRDYGQAVALYADGNNIKVENCKLIGCQDTLFTAPLPPKKPGVGTNGKGPKAEFERRNGDQFYINCYIEGDIDFIFGGARAYFYNCTIFSRNNITEEDGKHGENIVKGYVAAPCTPCGEKIGYVFNNCRFESDNDKETVYLARPWREYAKVVVVNSKFGKHIKKCGWHDWDKKDAHDTIYFAEYNNVNEDNVLVDMSLREDYVQAISKEEVEKLIKYFTDKM